LAEPCVSTELLNAATQKSADDSHTLTQASLGATATVWFAGSFLVPHAAGCVHSADTALCSTAARLVIVQDQRSSAPRALHSL
jgi:hypothetical protein